MIDKISNVQLNNFGMFPSFRYQGFSRINLLIGENGTGKTFFLKALYSATRAIEEYQRGDDIRPIDDILSQKLRWTFQVDKLGDLVMRNQPGFYDMPVALQFKMTLDEQFMKYALHPGDTFKASSVEYSGHGRDANSIFIPAKEVLSLYPVILKSREIDRSFGFDDTYYDLIKALSAPPKRGRNFDVFASSRSILRDLIDGKTDYDEASGKWYYINNNNCKFTMGATSEGIKKISIMDRLLSNGYLNKSSVVFIDEIESALHPGAVCTFLDMICNIADNMGLQFFIATHSYFVIKKLTLIAMKEAGLVTCISLHKNKRIEFHDLHDGMPDNSIIDAAVQLYDMEIEERL